MKVKRISLSKFKEIYRQVPRLCVEVVLLKSRSLLLTQRAISPAVGQWHTPGGTVLKGEDLKQAVQRVAKEELGLSVEVGECIGVIEYKSYFDHYSQDISLAFLVKIKNTKKIKLDRQADKFAFFSELPKNMIKDQKDFYSKILKLRMSKNNFL
jgi:colanic acid biosynthesis protein WcaH